MGLHCGPLLVAAISRRLRTDCSRHMVLSALGHQRNAIYGTAMPANVRRILADRAAIEGHVEVLEWLFQRGHFHAAVCRSADIRAVWALSGRGGRVGVLSWARDRRLGYDLEAKRLCAEEAALGDRVEVLDWLLENRAGRGDWLPTGAFAGLMAGYQALNASSAVRTWLDSLLQFPRKN